MISCLKIAVCGQEDYSLECRCNNMLMIPDWHTTTKLWWLSRFFGFWAFVQFKDRSTRVAQWKLSCATLVNPDEPGEKKPPFCARDGVKRLHKHTHTHTFICRPYDNLIQSDYVVTRWQDCWMSRNWAIMVLSDPRWALHEHGHGPGRKAIEVPPKAILAQNTGKRYVPQKERSPIRATTEL